MRRKNSMRKLGGGAILLNLFIGGVGATISTPTLLVAQFTGITTVNVSNFSVDGSNNVSCLIDADYSLILGGFSGNTSLTWFIDLQHCIHCGTQEAFNGCTNMKYLYVPYATSIGFSGAQSALNNLNSLMKGNFDSALTGGRSLCSNADFKTLRLPILNNFNISFNSYQTFQGLSFLERLDIRSVSSALVYYAINPYFANVKTGCKIVYNSGLGLANRKAWATASFNPSTANGNTITINGLVYTAGASTTTTGQFDNVSGNQFTRTGALVAAINSDTRTGTLGNVLAQTNSSTTLLGFYVDDVIGVTGNSIGIANTSGTVLNSLSGSTFKGGYDLHKNLMYLRDDRSCVMIEALSPISVPAPSGLSYSNQTSNTVDLNFTAPTPNANGTECYEAWVDDGTIYRKLFEFKEIAGNGSTLNLSEVITDVGTLSGTKIKIRTMDGQMNYSAFSNEITIA